MSKSRQPRTTASRSGAFKRDGTGPRRPVARKRERAKAARLEESSSKRKNKRSNPNRRVDPNTREVEARVPIRDVKEFKARNRTILMLLVLGFVNALIHGKDAWATMPAGLYLSAIVTLLALVAACVGYSGFRVEEVK